MSAASPHDLPFLEVDHVDLEVLPRRPRLVRRPVIVLATASRRLVSGLVDAVLVALLTIGIWSLGLGGFEALLPADGQWAFYPEHLADTFNAQPWSLVRPFFVAPWAAATGLGLIALLTDGRSPGKYLTRTRVVTANGLPAGPGALLRRSLGVLVSSLTLGAGWWLACVLPSRRTLHDLIAGTWVATQPDR